MNVPGTEAIDATADAPEAPIDAVEPAAAPAAPDAPEEPVAPEPATTPPAAPERERVRVLVRVRPLSGAGETRAVVVAGGGAVRLGSKTFEADGVLGEDATQTQVYAACASSLSALHGAAHAVCGGECMPLAFPFKRCSFALA